MVPNTLSVAVAATKSSKTLLALTTAALSLPGIESSVAEPVTEPSLNLQVGHYQENRNRMKADVFSADSLVPVSDQLEFSLRINSDVYSGASPAYNVPGVMKAQSKRILGTGNFEAADIIVSASPVVGTFEVSNSLQGFKAFEDALLDYVLTTPFPLQTVEGGLAAGYRAVLERNVPQLEDVVQENIIHPREARSETVIGASYYLRNMSLNASFGHSDEPDYRSTFSSLGFDWESADRLTTVSAAYNLTVNDVERAQSHGDGDHVHPGDEDYPLLREDNRSHTVNLGLSQVLSRNRLLQVSTSFTHQSGYLSSPYKLVYVRGEITPEEYAQLNLQNAIFQDVTQLQVAGVDLFYGVRPDQRQQFTFSTLLRQHVDALNGTLHADYRYYADDWDIDAHTLEIAWFQSALPGVSIEPYIRYYSQTEADFFAPFFLSPRSDGIYSSDYRLASFGSINSGVTLRKEFSNAASLQVGFEFHAQRSRWRLQGEGSGDYLDYNSYLYHAGVNLNLNAKAVNKHAHSHHSHAMLNPAGIMFSHVLRRKGDTMFSYQFMSGARSGGIHEQQDRVTDSRISSQACPNFGCTNAPQKMTMNMHMLHLMYAATDNFTLAFMPRLINREMAMRGLAGIPANSSHEHPHSNNGIGDTVIAALWSVFRRNHHGAHLGLGVSIPTGSLDATLDGTSQRTSELQGYGMQLGSGSWELLPSITTSGHYKFYNWGAQLRGVFRLDNNEQGYQLGDELVLNLWNGVQVSDWSNVTLRLSYSDIDAIQGETNRINSQSTTVDFTQNYGGQFVDVGIGTNINISNGLFAGHALALEWIEPVHNNYNGFQLDRRSMLTASWQFHF